MGIPRYVAGGSHLSLRVVVFLRGFVSMYYIYALLVKQ